MTNFEVRFFFLAELVILIWAVYLILFGYPWYVYLLAILGGVLAVVSYETSKRVGCPAIILLSISVLFALGMKLT